MWEELVTPGSLDGLKLLSICKLLPGSMSVEYMGREGKVWEWDISPRCKNDDPLPVLGYTITASLHQSNLVLVPIILLVYVRKVRSKQTPGRPKMLL